MAISSTVLHGVIRHGVKPVNIQSVSLYTKYGKHIATTQTDENGQYEFKLNQCPRKFYLKTNNLVKLIKIPKNTTEKIEIVSLKKFSSPLYVNAIPIRGKLHYENLPLSNQKLSIFDKNSHELIARAITDKRGKFIFTLPKADVKHDILIHVFEEKLPSEGSGEWKIAEKEVEVKDKPIKLGIIDVKPIPHPFSTAYKWSLAKAAGSKILKVGLINILKIIPGDVLNVSHVQKLFGSNPNLTLTPNNTIEMLLNGLCPWFWKKREENQEFLCEINWQSFHKDHSAQLPNATLIMTDEIEPRVKAIDIDGTLFKTDHPEFQRALYLFNSAALIWGEHMHLACHMEMGDLAEGINMFLNKHILKVFLLPYIDGVQAINQFGLKGFFGNGLIFGEMGILNASGLSEKGIIEVLDYIRGGMDWKFFKPRKPLNDQHRFALAAQEFWECSMSSLNEFFEQNKEKIADPNTWFEIERLSHFLLKKSPSFQNYGNDAHWIDTQEFGDTSLKERVYNKEKIIKSFRPITRSKNGPQEGDLESLKQFCCYIRFQVFWHWVLHQSQKTYATQLNWATLAPQNKNDTFGGTRIDDAKIQLAIAQGITSFKETHTLFNHPQVDMFFKNALLEKREKFKNWQFDIEKCPVNIEI